MHCDVLAPGRLGVFVIISWCTPLCIGLWPAHRHLALQVCEGSEGPRLGCVRPKSQGAAFSAAAPLDEGAQAGDRFADDESIHLARPFVGVDGFGIGDKAADMIVEQNAIAPEQLAGVADSLAALDGSECFRQRCVFVGHESLRLQLP